MTKLLAEHRLVSLLGTGRVGKSRLAIEVARNDAPNHPDGCWWVDMAEVETPDGVGAALVTALRVAVPPGMSAERALTSYLSSREILLLIDNAERLTDAVGAVVVSLLTEAPQLAVLLTSRAPLGLVGERGTSATHGERESIEAMCDLVDHLPLGVELAAAAAADGGLPTALADVRSHDGLIDAPPGSHRGMPGVSDHGGLVAVLSSTTDMLTAAPRELLCRLTVIHGTFDRDAVGAVAATAAWGSDLQRLRDVALVSALDTHGTGLRFRLLDTTAAFAGEIAEADTLRHRGPRAHQGRRPGGPGERALRLGRRAGESPDRPDRPRRAPRGRRYVTGHGLRGHVRSRGHSTFSATSTSEARAEMVGANPEDCATPEVGEAALWPAIDHTMVAFLRWAIGQDTSAAALSDDVIGSLGADVTVRGDLEAG